MSYPQPQRPQPRTRSALPGQVLVGAGIILIGVIGWYVFRSPSALIEVKGAPSLKTDKNSVDLGDVKLGAVVEASFQLTNVGDQPLRLTEAPYTELLEGC